MPIQPKPFKLECPKCGYSKTVRPKSDTDMLFSSVCPKCGAWMERKEADGLSRLWNTLTGKR